jgi:hypothetical protein
MYAVRALKSTCVVVVMVAVTGVTGCTWVRLTDEGAAVRLAVAGDIAECRRVGTVSATTADRVGLARHPDKVAEELIVLASNQAANIGGDTMVADGPPQGGSQRFTVYRCD